MVAPVSALKIIILAVFMSNACLYELNLGVTEVLFVEFSKIFLFLFSANIGTVPHRHYMHPQLLPSRLFSIVAFTCVQVIWSCNFLPCSCHVHVSINICQNIQALDDEFVLGEVWWRE